MSSDPTTELSRIKAESSAWSIARDRGLTPDEQDRLLDWLAADPRHSEWLAKHQQGLKRLRLLAHWRPEHSTRPNPDLLAAPLKSKARTYHLRWLAPIGLAASFALVTFWWSRSDPSPPGPEPVIVRKVLEDGSTIDLNHGADVEITYTTERRDIRLLRGEATFKVAKNPERPFIVTASGVTVRAVGTAFNVNLSEQAVAVMVTEGRVKVDGPAQNSNLPNATSAPEIPILEAGERTTISLTPNLTVPPTIETVPPAEMNRVLAWQPRQLEFNDTPLAQVAAEFNATNRLKIVIDDPILAAMPMGASLRSDNVEGFVRILESTFGLTVERRGDMIMIRRRQ
jgi:transmembrane sensor